MKFTFQTEYNTKAMTVLARAVRKTLRKKRSRRSHIFGIAVIALAVLLLIPSGDAPFVWNVPTIINLLVIAVLSATLLFEDRLNGYIARKKQLPGMVNSTTVFTDNNFTTACQVATTEWNYESIVWVAETKDYFVFLYSRNHGQLYEKASMTGGTLEEFRTFIEEKTDKKIQKI